MKLSILDRAYQRYGRVKVGVWVTLVSFAVICGCGVFFLTEFVLRPRIAQLGVSTSADVISSVVFPWVLAYAVLAIVLAAVLLQFSLVAPVMHGRRKLEASLANAAPAEQLEFLLQQREAQNAQLDAILEDNLALRDARKAARAEVQTQTQRLAVLVNGVDENVLLLDETAHVVAASQMLAVSLGLDATKLTGQAVTAVLPLFAVGQDETDPEPLRGLVAEVMARASSTAYVQDVLVRSPANEWLAFTITVQSVISTQGRASGAWLRLVASDQSGESSSRAGGGSGALDHATGLPQRDAFESRLNEMLKAAEAQAATHSLALITVDNLQAIYNQHGYWAAEELLWNVVQTLRKSLGATAELFRVTQLHFAWLLPFESPSEAHLRCEGARLAVKNCEVSWQGHTYGSSVSIAIVSVDAETSGVSALITAADVDLRELHATGGNRVHTHEVDELLEETRAIEKRLISWLRDTGDQSHLQLQSVELAPADKAEKSLVYAQLRVEMDDGFWIDPMAFLSSAENSGLLHKIDTWLLSRVLTAMKRMAKQTEKYAQIVVPINVQSMADEGFAEEILKLVEQSPIDPTQLVLSLDESACRSRLSMATHFVEVLQASGVSFALTGCRAGVLQDLVPRFKPRFIAPHASLLVPARAKLHLNYLSGIGQDLGCLPFVLDVTKTAAAELHAAGAAYVAQPQKGLGPLY